MRNLAAKVPEDLWPEFKARAQAAYQAPSRAIARDLAAGLVADYASELPSAVACFEDDLEACIAHLRMPITHRRAIRTTNLLDYMSFPPQHRTKLHSTDEIDKMFLSTCAMVLSRGRPRGKERRVGWKRRRAAYGDPAGLRRPRARSFGGRGRQAATKCSYPFSACSARRISWRRSSLTL